MPNLIPTVRKRVHPFFIDIVRKNGKEYLSVNYHSRLFTGMTLNEKYFSYNKISITGLDFLQSVPASFPGKNYYCVLEITVSNLSATKAAIVWVEDDKSVEKLNPVEFASTDDLKQTKARIIIGVYIFDGEATAGTLSPDAGGAKTSYISQFVHSDLMICNMVFDGIPIIYPTPFGGGRLNF